MPFFHWLSGRKEPENDADRWQRLSKSTWRCQTCGQHHQGLFDLACLAPDPWPGKAEESSAKPAERDPDNFLSDDFCVVNGKDFFVRAILPIPVIGTDHHFAYGVWSSLSEKNFRRYAQTFHDDPAEQDDAPWFGWFCNELKGYPSTAGLKCAVWLRPNRRRPTLKLQSTNHPLGVDQRDGISLKRLLEVYALNGHSMGDRS